MEDKQHATDSRDGVTVRPLRERDLDEADRVVRLAFGTFLGLPDPMVFMGDADYVRTRWRADPSAAFAAESSGTVAGSAFAANWGSVGFFGPLTVHPALWDRGVGRLLMGPVEERLAARGTRLAGLFTFPHSPKHLAFYQKFGYRPQSLTAVLARPVSPTARPRRATLLSEAPAGEQEACLDACRELTDAVYEGLDVRGEIRAVAAQGLGDTVLLGDGERLEGLAICHCGPGTEAGSGTCYVKFGAVRPGAAAAASFSELLSACEVLAGARGAARLVAGVNTARHEAYGSMLGRGFRIELLGVVMHRPDEPGYSRPGTYVLDDWR